MIPEMKRPTLSISALLGMEDVMRVQDPTIFATKGKCPKWFIRPVVDGYDTQGNATRKQTTIYLGRCDQTPKRKAIEKKNAVMDRINRSQVMLQSQLKFGDLVEYYLKQFVRAHDKLATTTQAKYEGHIARHILPAWKDKMLAEIRGLEVDKWLMDLGQPSLKDGKVVKGLSWNTRTDLRNIMSGIWTKAFEWGLWTGENPIQYVSAGRKRLVYERVKLTDGQTVALLAELPADVRLICMTALFCTLRISEIMGLRWKNVDLINGVLNIRERYHRGDMDTVKTGGSVRSVQLGHLVGPLRDLFPGDGRGEEFVFTVKTHPRWGKPGVSRDSGDINQHFLRPAAKKLGIYRPGFGFHAFRRESITALAGSAGAVQAMLAAGHSKLDMTMLYALDDSGAQRAAVEQFQDRLKVIPIRQVG